LKETECEKQLQSDVSHSESNESFSVEETVKQFFTVVLDDAFGCHHDDYQYNDDVFSDHECDNDEMLNDRVSDKQIESIDGSSGEVSNLGADVLNLNFENDKDVTSGDVTTSNTNYPDKSDDLYKILVENTNPTINNTEYILHS
jgi:hypothetical protein